MQSVASLLYISRGGFKLLLTFLLAYLRVTPREQMVILLERLVRRWSKKEVQRIVSANKIRKSLDGGSLGNPTRKRMYQ